MKTCKVCGISKEESEYYLWKGWRPPTCKVCHNNKLRESRKENVAERRASRRKYVAANREKDREHKRKSAAKYKNKYRPDLLKERTRAATRRARERGEILWEPCFVCDSQKSELHHPDYSDPFNVIWLCHLHHSALHANLISLINPRKASIVKPILICNYCGEDFHPRRYRTESFCCDKHRQKYHIAKVSQERAKKKEELLMGEGND